LRGLRLECQLGAGFDGIVWKTDRPSAIKWFHARTLYENERNVYLRIAEHGIEELVGFTVPKLIDHDDSLLVVEMETVSPPFVLDFAGAYLDRNPPFDAEQLAEWMRDRAELFEADWPQVKLLWYAFQRYGIVLNDLKPGNVLCR
jgi:hypothetical protein